MGLTVSGIVKPVNFGIPSNQRMQQFTSADATQGDILNITKSLGRAANSVVITPSTAGFSVRFNVIRWNAPPREGNDLLFTSQLPNLALLNEYEDTSMPAISIAAGQTFSINSPVESIKLVTCSGAFTIIAQ
jgi:hypothetical protein